MNNQGFVKRAHRQEPMVRHASPHRVIPWVIIGLVIIGIGGGGLLWDDLFGVSISGSLSAAGSKVGNWVFSPDICESGARRSFYGVRMFSSHDSQMAFVYSDDPLRGRGVEVKVPGRNYGYRFFEQDCRVLNASVQDGPRINSVRAISGTIDVDCQTDGGSLNGRLKFVNCA